MARRVSLRAVAVAAVVLTASVPGTAVGSPAESGGASIEARWTPLLEAHPARMLERAEAEGQLAAADRRATDAAADLAWIADAVTDSEVRLEDATRQRDEAAARRQAAGRYVLQAEALLDRLRLRMDAHAATIYKHGPPALGPIESLLRSGSPGDYVLRQRVSGAVLADDDLAVRRAKAAHIVAQEAHARTSLQAAIARSAWDEVHEQTELLRELQADQQDHVRSTRGALSAYRSGREAARRAEVDSTAGMVAEEGRIGAEDPARRQALEQRRASVVAAALGELEAAYPYLGRGPRRRPATMPPVAGYRCPVEGGRFVNDWAFPRPGGRSHEGTDVFAPRGTTVVAVADGQVTAIDRHDSHDVGEVSGDLGGLTVTLVTPEGERWYYAHLDAIADGLEIGAAVTGGQELGTIGDSGNARGGVPHLHLGRYWRDTPVNPYPSLALACR